MHCHVVVLIMIAGLTVYSQSALAIVLYGANLGVTLPDSHNPGFGTEYSMYRK